jgi:hypothetical protein
MLNEYLNAVRQFCELQAKRGRTGQFIRYQILADEVNDPTLVSFRVYGTRDEANVVMVAAGGSETRPRNVAMMYIIKI